MKIELTLNDELPKKLTSKGSKEAVRILPLLSLVKFISNIGSLTFLLAQFIKSTIFSISILYTA